MSVIDARDENSAATEFRQGQSDMSKAADRAGAIVSEQIRAMLDAAETRAAEIRRSAENDARELRQGAAREAGTLFEKLEALEAPLDALVGSLRGELDSLSTEFRRHWPEGEDVITREGGNGSDPAYQAQPEPQARPEPVAEEEPEAEQAEEPEAEEPVAEAEVEEAVAEDEAEEPEVEEIEEPQYEAEQQSEAATQVTQAQDAVQAPAPEAVHTHEEPSKKRGPRGWLKRRKSALFITTPGQCAVCYRSYAAGSEEALAESGWKVSGELGLCPDCQNDGWQLPEGARLPYRRAAG